MRGWGEAIFTMMGFESVELLLLFWRQNSSDFGVSFVHDLSNRVFLALHHVSAQNLELVPRFLMNQGCFLALLLVQSKPLTKLFNSMRRRMSRRRSMSMATLGRHQSPARNGTQEKDGDQHPCSPPTRSPYH